MKIINIRPGGLYGFYAFGVCNYIKEKFDTKNYHFCGASAGAWNSLYMVSNVKNNKFYKNVILKDINETKNINELQNQMKQNILNNFDETNFDLKRLHISVASIQSNPIYIKKHIYNNFYDLEDAINCCIASSNIPIISGHILYNYRDEYCIDGGVFNNPFYDNIESTIEISHRIWKNEDDIQLYGKMQNILNIIDEGYEDSNKNHNLLYNYFCLK
jgi:hypothetical protein